MSVQTHQEKADTEAGIRVGVIRKIGTAEYVAAAVLVSDSFLDHVLDELTERAGHDRSTDALGLARWDLRAALRAGFRQEIKRRERAAA